jgi:hypothetical protein
MKMLVGETITLILLVKVPHGQWIVGRQVKYKQIVGRQMNVGWEIIVGWKKYVGRGNSVGRHRKVGRERPLPTGLTVTDKIGRRN